MNLFATNWRCRLRMQIADVARLSRCLVRRPPPVTLSLLLIFLRLSLAPVPLSDLQLLSHYLRYCGAGAAKDLKEEQKGDFLMKWSCYSSALYNKWCRTNKKARGSHGWLGEERVSVSGPPPAHIHDLPWESPRKFKQTQPRREVSPINNCISA